ncbi:MAG: hypothetical protein M1318_00935 [Firmicutes bacterium]|nr:hypothetical protein [Bacillota bacterium]
MPRTIYITHCSKNKKTPDEIGSRLVAVDELHTGKTFRRFISTYCQRRVDWAIYDKHPNELSDMELENYAWQIAARLPPFTDIVSCGNFDSSYLNATHQELLAKVALLLRDRFRQITHLNEIHWRTCGERTNLHAN